MNIITISPVIWRAFIHTQSHCSFSPLSSNKSSRYATLAFSNLVSPSRITTSGIPRLPEVSSLIVWSNLHSFLVHQPAATNSMHWQSTHTPHTQHLQSDPHLQSSWRSVVESFCRHSQHVKTVGYFRRGTQSLMFDWILSATLSKDKISTTGILNSSSLLFLLIPPNLGRTPHSHFLERELIHWVTKAKNVEWWHAPLVLRDFSQSNMLDVINAWNDIKNNFRILFTCNTPCNISKLFKFQWYFKEMYSYFQAIMKFITMKIFIMKILIKYF